MASLITDPCAPEKKAVTKYLSAAEVMSYIMDCFHIALEYFSACDQKEDNKSSTQKRTEGAVASSHSHGKESLNQDSSLLSTSLEEDSLLANYSPEETDGENSVVEPSPDGDGSGFLDKSSSDHAKHLTDDSFMFSEGEDCPPDIPPVDTITERTQGNERNIDKVISDDNVDQMEADNPSVSISDETIENESLDHLRGTSLVVEGESNNEADSLPIDFNFSFDSENLSRGQKVPKICSNCQQEGHVSKVRLNSFFYQFC